MTESEQRKSTHLHLTNVLILTSDCNCTILSDATMEHATMKKLHLGIRVSLFQHVRQRGQVQEGCVDHTVAIGERLEDAIMVLELTIEAQHADGIQPILRWIQPQAFMLGRVHRAFGAGFVLRFDRFNQIMFDS